MKTESEGISGATKFAILIISALFILMLFAHGFLRWTLGLTVFILIALSMGMKLKEDFHRVEVWNNKKKLDETLNTRTGGIDQVIDGAVSGKKISQALLEQRIKSIIQRKLSEKQDISRNGFKELLEDRKKLKETVEDDTIVDFLVNARDLKDIGKDVKKERDEHRRKDGEGYRRWIEEVLDSIEGYG